MGIKGLRTYCLILFLIGRPFRIAYTASAFLHIGSGPPKMLFKVFFSALFGGKTFFWYFFSTLKRDRTLFAFVLAPFSALFLLKGKVLLMVVKS